MTVCVKDENMSTVLSLYGLTSDSTLKVTNKSKIIVYTAYSSIITLLIVLNNFTNLTLLDYILHKNTYSSLPYHKGSCNKADVSIINNIDTKANRKET